MDEKKLKTEAMTFKKRLEAEGFVEDPLRLVAGSLPLKSEESEYYVDSPPPDPSKHRQDVSVTDGDLHWFTLGPVYVTIGVPFDIVEEFKNTTRPKATRGTCKTDVPLFPQLPGWSDVLEFMDPASFDSFCQFIGGTSFQASGDRFYFIRSEDLLLTVGQSSIRVTVFLPETTDRTLSPDIRADGVHFLPMYKKGKEL